MVAHVKCQHALDYKKNTAGILFDSDKYASYRSNFAYHIAFDQHYGFFGPRHMTQALVEKESKEREKLRDTLTSSMSQQHSERRDMPDISKRIALSKEDALAVHPNVLGVMDNSKRDKMDLTWLVLTSRLDNTSLAAQKRDDKYMSKPVPHGFPEFILAGLKDGSIILYKDGGLESPTSQKMQSRLKKYNKPNKREWIVKSINLTRLKGELPSHEDKIAKEKASMESKMTALFTPTPHPRVNHR